ncbi:hypothetical protein LX36DRAFT_355342 [Colletotrichum falcatum]|nr:hypothetical protein LX36DRAFT_355342 [Colletotrichum falcatum]
MPRTLLIQTIHFLVVPCQQSLRPCPHAVMMSSSNNWLTKHTTIPREEVGRLVPSRQAHAILYAIRSLIRHLHKRDSPHLSTHYPLPHTAAGLLAALPVPRPCVWSLLRTLGRNTTLVKWIGRAKYARCCDPLEIEWSGVAASCAVCPSLIAPSPPSSAFLQAVGRPLSEREGYGCPVGPYGRRATRPCGHDLCVMM